MCAFVVYIVLLLSYVCLMLLSFPYVCVFVIMLCGCFDFSNDFVTCCLSLFDCCCCLVCVGIVLFVRMRCVYFAVGCFSNVFVWFIVSLFYVLCVCSTWFVVMF